MFSFSNLLLAFNIGDFTTGLIPVIIFVIWLINTIVSAKNENLKKKRVLNQDVEYVTDDQLNHEIEKFLRDTGDSGVEFINPQDEPIEATVIHDPDASVQDLSEHVRSHLGVEDTNQRHQVGTNVDDQIEDHIHQIFDHQIGSFANIESLPDNPLSESSRQPVQAVEIAPKGSQDFAVLFQNFDNLKQAIIMQEILTRPEDRF